MPRSTLAKTELARDRCGRENAGVGGGLAPLRREPLAHLDVTNVPVEDLAQVQLRDNGAVPPRFKDGGGKRASATVRCSNEPKRPNTA